MLYTVLGNHSSDLAGEEYKGELYLHLITDTDNTPNYLIFFPIECCFLSSHVLYKTGNVQLT